MKVIANPSVGGSAILPPVSVVRQPTKPPITFMHDRGSYKRCQRLSIPEFACNINCSGLYQYSSWRLASATSDHLHGSQ